MLKDLASFKSERVFDRRRLSARYASYASLQQIQKAQPGSNIDWPPNKLQILERLDELSH
jgi:hypothetical protein